ncbi:Cell growth-regulating nucleolar protein [Armadillidium vulgare]|nr:Cell growth-regulating nucleolar protein [Armadillidium vulgare]
MVFFTCNNCGECLKKNAVQNHTFRCRTSQGVSCMDCHKVFGEDFVNHLSCVTEQEKYGGSGFVGKEAKNKKKQEQWNYLTNSLKMRSDLAGKFSQIASRALECFSQERNQQQNNSQTDMNGSKRKIDDNDDDSLHSKKIHLEEIKNKLSVVNKEEAPNELVFSLENESIKNHKKNVASKCITHEKGDVKVNMNKENNFNNDEHLVKENGDLSKFKWKSSIKKTLRAHNSKMKIKKLQKIIVNQYLLHIGEEDCANDAKELFQKKINNKKFIILEDKYIQLK